MKKNQKNHNQYKNFPYFLLTPLTINIIVTNIIISSAKIAKHIVAPG